MKDRVPFCKDLLPCSQQQASGLFSAVDDSSEKPHTRSQPIS
jgi:hypothetical protein